MRQRFNQKFVTIGLATLLVFSLSSIYFKSSFISLITSNSLPPKNEHLALENYLLRKQLETAQELLHRELDLLREKENLSIITVDELDELDLHTQEVASLFPEKLKALPAEVIFRSPQSWNSTFWINLGSDQSEKIDAAAIEKGIAFAVDLDQAGDLCVKRIICRTGINSSREIA